MTIAMSATFRLMIAALFLLIALPTLPACSAKKLDSLSVPLAFRPEKVIPGQYSTIAPSPGLRLHIEPVVDARTEQDRIGENIEVAAKGARPIYAIGQTPVEFVHKLISQELASAGYEATADEGDANRTLSITLDRFYTVESGRYRCDVAISSEVRSAAGQVLWQGKSVGTSERFGRSLSAENYNESFSDATLRAIADLMSNDAFRTALTVE